MWGVLHAWQLVARATIDRAAEVEIFMVGSVIEIEEVCGLLSYESCSSSQHGVMLRCIGVRHLTSKQSMSHNIILAGILLAKNFPAIPRIPSFKRAGR